ncbi:MAG: thiamine phosphate synthase [candidate division FCPU426 bacterium]
MASPVSDPRFSFYAITDQASAQGRNDLEVAKGLIAGGCSCLQYRAKKVSAKEQWPMAFALRALCLQAGVLFVVNDRLDLALDCGADGVHLGQDDLPLFAARRLAGKKMLLGRSTHSLEQAKRAEAEGADYIGYGPLYATATKENNVPPVGPQSLGPVLEALSIPVVAIGGIKINHLEALAQQGARHIAVVTALTGAPDVAAETSRFTQAWQALTRN